MPRKKSVDFEKSLKELESLVESMESGDLSLEASLKAFENGIKLTRVCQTALDSAEQKVEQLLEENDELTSEPFNLDASEDE